MTKAELVSSLYTKHGGLTKAEARVYVESMLEIIKESIAVGKHVKLSNFGTFQVKIRKPRKGRNPKTGVLINIPHQRVLIFKPSETLKNKIND